MKKAGNPCSRKYCRCDDITGLHAPQLANGNSALVHAGHSDGTQVDLRYADGQVGLSDMLGGACNGASIKALFDAGPAEVNAGQPTGSSVTRTAAWITLNRANLTAEAANARKVADARYHGARAGRKPRRARAL